MSHLKIFLLVLGIMIIQSGAAQTSSGNALAERIAQKMKDTLELSSSQTTSIYNVNIAINASKSQARALYSTPDSIANKLQRIENTRDSLYSLHLTQSQYFLYKQKKRNLISNN